MSPVNHEPNPEKDHQDLESDELTSPDNVLRALHETFSIDDMISLDEYQQDIGLMKFIREPFTEDFFFRYEDVIPTLMQNAEYDEDLEDRMYDDEYLQELAKARQRHERRRDKDNTAIEPEAITNAFWIRRNIVAYFKSLEAEVEFAYDMYPEGEGSQEAG